MSKELEALKLFEIEVNAIGWNDPRVEQFKEAFKILKQALTPPTQEEVCIELEKQYGKKFKYNTCNKEFFTWFKGASPFGDAQDYTSLENFRLGKLVTKNPRLITLIGRFYESLESKIK